MIRVDSYPTHEYNGIQYRMGKVLPYGATIVPNGVNFSIFSKYATSCDEIRYNKYSTVFLLHMKSPYSVYKFFIYVLENLCCKISYYLQIIIR